MERKKTISPFIALSLLCAASTADAFDDSRNASWYNVNGELAVIGLTGLGASYYLSPGVPSKYLIAGLGPGDFSTPLYASDTDINDGKSYLAGLGYEFKRHQSVEFNLGLTTHKVNSSVKLKTYTAQVLFNYQFY